MAERSLVQPQQLRETRSLGEIVQDILRDVQEVMRSELRLARAEMTDKAKQAGKAGGLLGVAAVAILMGLACLTAAAIAALALAMPVWLAALIVGVLLGCIGGAAYAGGRARLRRVKPVPERTAQTIKDDVEWAKQRTK
jgi:Flp pilus assembly protein TadB